MADSSPAILVRGLSKTFSIVKKPPGFFGALRGLWSSEVQEVQAVQGVDLEVEAGEIVAFIGPNGAGKSTTIKMLTGILHPSSGEAEVLGLTPWEAREELSYRIGSVFGARSQLWYHLPARETFRLLGVLFQVPRPELERRLGFLLEAFELEDLADVPVRKLSLGQRMRCEIAASLIHGPKVLFLDEPTIGLDVVAKRRIRELILRWKEEEGVTVLLTSHDAGDIEKLCKRTLIIHHGKVLVDRPTKDLKRRFFHHKLLGLRVRRPPPDFGATGLGLPLPGVRCLKQKKKGLKLEVDTHLTPVEDALAWVLESFGIEDITIQDPPLEDVIAEIFETHEAKVQGRSRASSGGSTESETAS